MIFAKNLVHYRKSLGLTQENIAQMCNVSRQAVTKWETGASLPDVYTIGNIAKVMNISIEDLVYYYKETNKSEIWDSAKEKIKEILKDSPITFTVFIEGLELISEIKEEKKLYLKCNREFVKDTIEHRHMNIIKHSVFEITGKNYEVILCN